MHLPAPSTYVGPARVFGLADEYASDAEPVEPLPIVRDIEDHESWLPDGHKVDTVPGPDLPPSLQEAVLAFIVGGAVRRLRGQGHKHNSMLVHVTRFTRVQQAVADQVSDLLQDTRDRLALGEGANPVLRSAAEALYNRDHLRTTRRLAETEDVAGLTGEMPAFDEVWREMRVVADGTKVHVVNGTAEDALAYVDHPDGLSVIAIGGDKLSRGLTLEGLSVSYYLRTTKMYDTLMQMGRWFGYRPGYLDLCRLYTTPQLVRWYVAITAAAAELHTEFEAMAALGQSPEQYGLRVRQHPDGLLVTSPTKLRHATTVKISYAATISETTTFLRGRAQKKNWRSLEAFVRELGQQTTSVSGLDVWRGVPAESVTRFIDRYVPHPAAVQTQPKALTDYIRSRIDDGELTNWTVCLANVSATATTHPLAGRSVGLTRRHRLGAVDTTRYTVKRIGSPRHEIVDLEQGTPKWERLLEATIAQWEQSTRVNKSSTPPNAPSGLHERRDRDPGQGLLLLYPLDPAAADDESAEAREDAQVPFVGFAISFPRSELATPVEYKVNEVFWEQEYGVLDDDSDEEAQ